MKRIVPDEGYEIVIGEQAYSEIVVKEVTGFEVRETGTPPEPPIPVDPVERAKSQKLAEIDAYDKSPAVNSFTLGGQVLWLTVDERQQIATQISANEAVGRIDMTRWFGGRSFTFPLNLWKQMLVALEVYAGDALNVTEAHKAAVRAMSSVEDIVAYDITQGYPETLAF